MEVFAICWLLVFSLRFSSCSFTVAVPSVNGVVDVDILEGESIGDFVYKITKQTVNLNASCTGMCERVNVYNNVVNGFGNSSKVVFASKTIFSNCTIDLGNTFDVIDNVWHDLDKIMITHQSHRYMYGHIRPVQLLDMLKSVDELQANTYCEIGMNGGHSAAAILASRPHIVAHVFDLGEFAYSQPVADALTAKYPNRFNYYFGDSNVTVPQFAGSSRMQKCDVVFIDGSHIDYDVVWDIIHVKDIVSNKHMIYFDDTHCLDHVCFFDSLLHGSYDKRSSFNEFVVVASARDAVSNMHSKGLLSSIRFFDYALSPHCNYRRPNALDKDAQEVMYPWGWAKGVYNMSNLGICDSVDCFRYIPHAVL